jgi:hypothetical protein
MTMVRVVRRRLHAHLHPMVHWTIIRCHTAMGVLPVATGLCHAERHAQGVEAQNHPGNDDGVATS